MRLFSAAHTGRACSQQATWKPRYGQAPPTSAAVGQRCLQRRPRTTRSTPVAAAAEAEAEAADASAADVVVEEPRVVDWATMLAESRRESGGTFIFQDFGDDDGGGDDFPVWEHEHRFQPGFALEPRAATAAAAASGLLDASLQESQWQVREQQPPPLPSAYSADSGFREMDALDLAEAVAAAPPGTPGAAVDLVLDVRSAAEVSAGPSIPGALNVPLERLSDAVRAGELDAFVDRHVAVVCASGQRSAQATVRLSKVFNFLQVTNVRGGVGAYAAAVGAGGGAGGGGGCGCGGGGGGGGCHQ